MASLKGAHLTNCSYCMPCDKGRVEVCCVGQSIPNLQGG